MIDWLLKLMGQTTRKELLETIAILRNQCDHYQLVLKKERESYGESLQQINDKWSEQHQSLMDEMQANGLTKAQLDEQAHIQLEMDSIRAEFDRDRKNLMHQINCLFEEKNAAIIARDDANKQNNRYLTRALDAERVAKQQESIAKGWQAHYEQLRDMRDANAVA